MSVTEPQTIQLGNGAKTLLIDVNPDKPYVRFRLGEESVDVGKTDLWAAIFAIADPETQEKLMPVRQTEVMHYSKFHRVRVKRDIKAGEELRVRCETSVPLTVVEGLKGMVEKQTKSKIWVPGGR